MDDIGEVPGAPPSVLAAAREIFPWANPEQKLVIRRLLTDERMQIVWTTLSRRRRDGSGRYFNSSHPALPSDWGPVNDMMQQRKMTSLFMAAVGRFYYDQRPVITRRELDKLRRPYLDLAKRLEKDIISLRKLGVGRPTEISAIIGAAAECKWTAHAIGSGWIIIDRNVSDLQLRGSLQILVEEMKELFGSPLYGIAATIASIAFDRRVTVAMVREAAS